MLTTAQMARQLKVTQACVAAACRCLGIKPTMMHRVITVQGIYRTGVRMMRRRQWYMAYRQEDLETILRVRKEVAQ